MAISKDKIISVFGASGPAAGCEAYEVARSAGRELARLGYTIANGGYGGTMEASARGAKEAGGRTIGVACDIWPRRPSEQYLDEIIHTKSYPDRLIRLIELGEGGYLVLPGGTGTLVELAWVWEQACKRPGCDRPVVLLGDFWRPLVEMMSAARDDSGQYVKLIRSPEEIPHAFAPHV